MIRARLEHPGRTVELEPAAALLVTDKAVHAACASEQEAFDLWLRLTEWLTSPKVSTPSVRWRALLVALAHGRNAKRVGHRHDALPDYSSADTVLAILKETEGPEVAERVRRAIVDRMRGVDSPP